MIVLKGKIKGLKYLVVLFAMGVLLVGCKQGGQDETVEHEEHQGEHEEEHVDDGKVPYPIRTQQEGRGEREISAPTIEQIKGNPSLLTLDAVLSGEVEETNDVQGYTYIKLKDATGSIWAAVSTPPVEVKGGDRVGITKASVMGDFYSKSLDKTFDLIVFGQITGSQEAGISQSPVSASQAGHPAGEKTALEIGNVTKATGDNAYTIEQTFADKPNLANKEIVLRGVVVRYSEGILGKNWLHIQDGTGTPEDKNNDLAVTTNGQSKIGDTVLVRGILHIDKQVGPGYFYDAILEDAEITVEEKG
ncbi:MAG: hypothetical protein ACE5IH_01455 [Thermodesulfobacteriota bacterium]